MANYLQQFIQRMEPWLGQVHCYWQQRTQREQQLLFAAGIFIVILSFYLLFQTLRSTVTELQITTAKQQQFIQLAKHTPPDTLQHWLTQPQIKLDNNLSQVTLVLQNVGLNDIVSNTQSDGKYFTLQFNEIGFDELMDFLQQVWQQQGIEISSIQLQRLDKEGAVSANVQFDIIGIRALS